jgi:hypothetical protein
MATPANELLNLWRSNKPSFIGVILAAYLILIVGAHVKKEHKENSFQSEDVSLSKLQKFISDSDAAASKARNVIDKSQIREDYNRRLCDEIHGGKISGWKGYLYDVGGGLSGVSAVFFVNGLKLSTTPIQRDSELYKRLANFRSSTWSKAGDDVIIDGFFDQWPEDSGCIGLGSSYQFTLTAIR